MSDLGFAGILDYLTGYKLGIEYLSNLNKVDVEYTVDDRGASSCVDSVDGVTQRCKIATDAGSSSGFGIFLGQPFKPKGRFYFGADFGISLRYLSGGLNNGEQRNSLARGLPMRELSYSLVALTLKPYVKLGWTPSGRIPDFLFSFGPAYQIAAGKVSINDKPKNVMILSGSSLLFGFFETEIIFLKFNGGYFSLFSSSEMTGNDEGTEFYPESVDGMSDITASFRSSTSGSFFSYGLRLLTNIP